jgi:hypothetical protein
VQGGYGTCFCSPGTKLAEHYECRGTSYLTNWELSRYCYFVNSCGAVRICQALRFCLTARNKSKNRDKQLTHIVRVSKSAVFFIIQYLSKGLDPFLSLGRNYHPESFDYNFSDGTDCQFTENI